MSGKKDSLRWTQEEDTIMKRYYRSKGVSYCMQRLPGRTQAAIIVHAAHLGLARKRPKPKAEWTKEEETVLLKHYLDGGVNACLPFLPSRTSYAIAHRAQKLGLTSKPFWTDEERDILRQYYPEEGRFCAARIPGKTESSVYDQAFKMGLVKKAVTPWTSKEDAVLQRNYKDIGECKRQLPHRSISSITKRLRSLGLAKKLRALTRPWTKEEENILLNYYLQEGNMTLLRLPGRSPHAIWVRANHLGLTRNKLKNSPEK